MQTTEPSSQPTVLITGASTGIGFASAIHLANRGWQVFAGVRREQDAERIRTEGGGKVTPIQLDVTDQETIATARRQLEEQLGERGLNGLVNNAGISLGGPVELVRIDDYRLQLEVNVIGQIAVTQAFLPLLRIAKGRIVMMSSVSGIIAVPFMSPYSSSKFALEALSDSLRLELKKFGIRVIVIQPGSIATPIWEKSLGKADAWLRSVDPVLAQIYEPGLTNARKRAQKTGERGLPVEVTARVVEEALASPNPSPRYRVGRGVRLVAVLENFAPGWLRDWLVGKSFGL